MKNLEELIKNKKAKVAIIGLGYVGLIQAVEIAKTGYDVLGIDIDKIRVRNLKKGKSYISDISDEELFSLIKNKKIKAFSNFSPLKIADIVLIAVPTPLDKNKVPDLSYIKNAVFEIKKRLHKEELVILESTSYPGTTEEIILKMLEDKNFKIGRDFYLATVPERIDPGAKIAIREIPRVIGGITLKCRKLAQLFYSQFIDHLYPVSSPKEKYKNLILGTNSRLDAIQAAILRVKLKYLKKWNKERAKKAAYYTYQLNKLDKLIVPSVAPNRTHTFHQYTIRVSARVRNKLIKYLSRNGIETMIYYPLPLHLQPAFKYLGYKRGDFPEAEKASKEVLSLPIYPELTGEYLLIMHGGG
jgi:hypothetical protein